MSCFTVPVGWAPRSSQCCRRSSSITIVEGDVCGLYRPIVSMKRPPRGERWSATTPRQFGFFLPPTRVSLTLTAISALRLAAARQLLQRGHLALRDLAHQLLHLGELLDQLSHGLHVGARAAGDAPPPRAVDDPRVGPLGGGHRLDDRLEPVE